jgi:hypothetical protein
MRRAWLFLMVALFFIVGLTLVVSVDTAVAQGKEICDNKKDDDGDKLIDGDDPDCQKKTAADCSPGYFKNHQDTWCDVVCPTGIIISDCSALNAALFSTGAGAGVLKNAAADFINDTCFETAEASPCTDD